MAPMRWLVAAVAAVSGLLAAPGVAPAATVAVNTTADENTLDNGRCALREAIQAGTNNSVAGTGCVAQGAFGAFDDVRVPAGTYRLVGLAGENVNEEGDIDVGAERVTVVHEGLKPAIVEGIGLDRIFHVLPGAALTVSGLVIQRGDAKLNSGGGIFNQGFLAVDRSTIRDNVATLGGGIATTGGSASIANTTISGNRSNDTGGGYHNSGGGTGDISNTTITRNIAEADGAGIQGGGGLRALDPINVHDSILAGNRDGDPSPVNAPDCSGGPNFVSGGDNLIQVPCPGAAVAAGDIIGGGPRLGSLRDNGGPTPTHALLVGSRAIDAGGPVGDCPLNDQRFVPRDLNPCDIGAYEVFRCAGRVVNRVGTDGRDVLRGTSRKDGIIGFDGRDVLKGLGQGDGLCGGLGRDRLLGGRGNDRLRGQGGRDVLIGGPGRDRLKGGPGRDRLRQ
jgi:CSLREA domain-containing protein